MRDGGTSCSVGTLSSTTPSTKSTNTSGAFSSHFLDCTRLRLLSPCLCVEMLPSHILSTAGLTPTPALSLSLSHTHTHTHSGQQAEGPLLASLHNNAHCAAGTTTQVPPLWVSLFLRSYTVVLSGAWCVPCACAHTGVVAVGSRQATTLREIKQYLLTGDARSEEEKLAVVRTSPCL